MNEYVKEYCKDFIRSKLSPNFAVFLKGSWGVGKTYFIDNLLKECKLEKSKKDKVFRLSLFGVSKYEDINTRLYQAAHPMLSSQGMKIASAVVCSALRVGAQFDLNGDNKKDLALSLSGLHLFNQGRIESSHNKILIVDDLERANLSLDQIFGYFSEMVTDLNTKVIFIGNEEKISETDKEAKERFLQIKEKTIGFEFEIKPDKKNAIKAFIEELKLSEFDYLAQNVEEISSVLGCNNLRTIRQALYNLHFLLRLIQEKFHEEDIKVVISIFLILFIQKSLSLISKGDPINGILYAYFEKKMSYEQYSKSPKESLVVDFWIFNKYIPLLQGWENLIFDGRYDAQWLLDIYKAEKTEIENKQKQVSGLFRLIGTWNKSSKKEFKLEVNKLLRDFKAGAYLHLGEILHFINLMILFSKWELVPFSEKDILKRAEYVLKKYNGRIFPVPDFYRVEMGYGGYSYCTEVPEIKSAFQRIREYNDQKIVEWCKKEIKNDIKLIETGKIEEFCKNILHVNGNNKYRELPVLSYLNIHQFYRNFKKLGAEDQQKIIEALSERYGIVYSKGTLQSEYKDDLENLETLLSLCENDVSNVRYDPQAFRKKNVVKSLKALVQYFKKQLDTKSLLEKR